MSRELVTYTFNTDVLPARHGRLMNIGTLQGVHIVMEAENREGLLATLLHWFNERDDVRFVDTGVSDKLGTGYIILEWDEYEVDPLLLVLLKKDEPIILDYTVYMQDTLRQEDARWQA